MGMRRLALLVFRDSGKSTLAALYASWQLASNPNLRVLVLSAEQHLASKMTRNIRHIIERHPRTRHLMPDHLDSWSNDRLTVKRSNISRDPSLLARGIFANLTGCRADIVICDDVEVPNTCETSQKRELLRQRLGEIEYIVVPDGVQIYIGTPHTYYSIYGSPEERSGTVSENFLKKFAMLTLPIAKSNGESRWPSRFTESDIDRIREMSGPTKFRSQMLLIPSRSDSIRLDPDLLCQYDAELDVIRSPTSSILKINERRAVHAVASWDPSYGKERSNDSSVVAATYQDEYGHYWIHDILYLSFPRAIEDGHDEATALCREVISFCVRNHIRMLTVETNGIGKFLPSLLRREIRRQHVKIAVVENESRAPKDIRILGAFDVLLAGRRLHAHKRVIESPLLEELREWRPNRKGRDDGLDAVSAGILACPHIQTSYREFHASSF